MKNVLGVIIFGCGILLSLYLGIWLCFVGGIIQFVEAVKMDPVSSFGIAVGILKVMAAGFVGSITFVACTALSAFFVKNKSDKYTYN